MIIVSVHDIVILVAKLLSINISIFLSLTICFIFILLLSLLNVMNVLSIRCYESEVC